MSCTFMEFCYKFWINEKMFLKIQKVSQSYFLNAVGLIFPKESATQNYGQKGENVAGVLALSARIIVKSSVKVANKSRFLI